MQTDTHRRLTFEMDCRQYPTRYGFPYTRDDYFRAKQAFDRGMPDLGRFCSAVALLITEQQGF